MAKRSTIRQCFGGGADLRLCAVELVKDFRDLSAILRTRECEHEEDPRLLHVEVTRRWARAAAGDATRYGAAADDDDHTLFARSTQSRALTRSRPAGADAGDD